MPMYLESWIAEQFGDLTGAPEIAGIIFLGFFTSFVMLQGTRLDGKLVVLTPVMILATIFIGFLPILLGLGLGVIIYLALTKLVNR